jgi:ABC-type transport system substrate-binding protein
MRRLVPSVALVPLLAVLWTASTAAQPGALRVGLPAIPATLDPGTQLDGPVPLIARQVFDTLVQYRAGSSDVEAGLATHWAVSRDGLSWWFRIREGVVFHDGTPLGAYHVAQSLERLLFPNPQMPSPNPVAPRLLRGVPGVVKDIRVPDARTVQVNLVLPYAPLLTVLAHPGFSVALAAAGEGGGPRWVGTGPFSIAEADPRRIRLEANQAYWGGPPRVAGVVFVEAPDPERAEAELEAGALDVFLPAAAPSRASGTLSVPGWRIGYLALQTERLPFSEKKARQAVAAALDPVPITQAVGPDAVPLQSLLPLGVWARREGSAILGSNPAGARRLLAEAGLASRRDPVSLIVAEGPGSPDAQRVAEALRAALAAGGLPAWLRMHPTDKARELVQQGEHDIALLEADVSAGDPHLLLYPLSASEGALKGPAAVNLSFYRNRQVDDLLIRGSQLSFRPERQRVYGRVQALLANELPWIPLYVKLHWALVRPEVQGLRLHPSGYHRLDRVVLGPAG